ncbi:MAG: hypothetical protein IJU77_11440 [Butyrivibrio sp.]|nr:hypothetical protein [Butyrivibrio sp.]
MRNKEATKKDAERKRQGETSSEIWLEIATSKYENTWPMAMASGSEEWKYSSFSGYSSRSAIGALLRLP